MHRESRFAVTLLTLAALFASPPTQAEESNDAGGVAFEAADGTGLSEILTRRRETLEKRLGGPLKGHEWWLWGLGSFDYDRDGDLDLVVSIHGGINGIIVRNELKETGKLRFVDATEELGVDGLVPPTDNYPLMWDFDGDGYLDIAGLLDDSPIPCLLNRGGKRFEKAAFSLHPINYPDAVRDLNGDGYVDIAQTGRSKRIVFTYDPASASFIRSESPADTPVALPAAVQDEIQTVRAKGHNRFIKFKHFQRDLNGDGRLDWIVCGFGSYSGDRLGWYVTASEDGALTDRTQALGLPREGAPTMVEDLDHDGDVDMLIVSGEKAGLYLNNGKDGFSLQAGPLTNFIKQRCPYQHVVMRADFDRDGDLDLALSNRRLGRAMVFDNLGGGKFAPVINVRGWDADPLVLRDINGDGLVDAIVGGADGRESVGVFLNVTKKTGNGCAIHPRMDSPNVYAVGARLEVFAAGGLDGRDPRPLVTEYARPDGSPICVGLGDATTFDLRVTFPGRPAMELKKVAAADKLFVTPSGVSASEPMPPKK